MAMCINSLVKIRGPLLALKDENNLDLAGKIPNRRQFDSLEEVLKPMQAIKDISDKLQTDKRPMIHMAIYYLMNLGKMSKSSQFQSSSKTTRMFVEAFEENLGKRIKNFGRNILEYNIACFLHPSFRGTLLKKYGGEDEYDRVISYIKKLYAEPPKNPPASSLDMFASQTLSQPSAEPSWIGLDLNEVLAEEGEMPASLRDKTPIEAEIEKWNSLSMVVKDVDIDILEYWRGKSKDLPLLGKLAKNILAIQVTSSSSERLFSEAGQVAGTKRPLLATTQCERLVFIHENHDRLVHMIKRWKTDIKDFTYGEKETSESERESTQLSQGTSAQALRDRDLEETPSLRFQRQSGSSDPDDPAALDINLVTPASPDPDNDAVVVDLPAPFLDLGDDDDDDDVEEVEDEEEEQNKL